MSALFYLSGEEDQDAYDINRLKKPIEEPVMARVAPMIPDLPKKQDMPPRNYKCEQI